MHDWGQAVHDVLSTTTGTSVMYAAPKAATSYTSANLGMPSS